jgi:cytochrome b subunit of formate dehydrogenase
VATSEPLEKELDNSKGKPDYFIRFAFSQRVEHLVLMFSFIVLAITGLAQRFYTVGWAEWIILNLGGIDYTRFVHRAFGLLFTLSAVYHLGYLSYSIFRRHSKPSMLPSLNDFRDIIALLKRSFGFTNQLPQFGRFDYRQKFEYWGIIFGSSIMIITGFILAYPVVVTNILPGQLVAAAGEAHGNEAMLAVMTIIIWHLYDVIFKPGIFPADTSIFTGKISRKRMLEEHPLEFYALTDTDVSETADSSPPEEPPSDLSAG